MGYHVYVETFNYICNSILRNPTLNFGIHFIFKSQEREFECGTAGRPTGNFLSLPTDDGRHRCRSNNRQISAELNKKIQNINWDSIGKTKKL